MTRREIPLDAAATFSSLARHDVDYVLIGGLAVQAHGHVRTTQDVDLVPEPSSLDRLADALSELNARPAGAGRAPAGWRLADELRAPAATVRLDSDAGGIDVHRDPPGAAPFHELRRRAMVVELGGVSVPVASRDDLIAMKLAAGRPLDRGDVIALTQRPPE